MKSVLRNGNNRCVKVVNFGFESLKATLSLIYTDLHLLLDLEEVSVNNGVSHIHRKLIFLFQIVYIWSSCNKVNKLCCVCLTASRKA